MNKFVKYEEGQGMVEYGLIVALIAVVCIVAFRFLGDGISDIGTVTKDIVPVESPSGLQPS